MLDLTERLALKDHVAEMASLEDLDQGDLLVYLVTLDLMELKEILVPLDQMVPPATVELLDHLDQRVQLDDRVQREQLEHQVCQVSEVHLVPKDQQEHRVTQEPLGHPEHQEGKEPLDQSVSPVFKESPEREAPQVQWELVDQLELEV